MAAPRPRSASGYNADAVFDLVWKALADPTRRSLLDRLRKKSCSTGELTDAFPHLSRFAVMKHLDVLREAELVQSRADGRRRVHTLNAVPLREVVRRWTTPYEDHWADALIDVKQAAESAAVRKAKKRSRA